MDGWQALQNWGLFVVVAGAIGGYYYYSELKKNQQRRQSLAGRKRSEQDVGTKSNKRSDPDASIDGPVKKRRVPRQAPLETPTTPAVVISHDDRAEQEELNNKKFAQEMVDAIKGTVLSQSKGQENKRIRTVKPGNAQETPVIHSPSSQGGAEAGGDLSPKLFPMPTDANDVSDMLEPKANGPSTIRVTAPSHPQKEKVKRQPKEEVVESKKARQNRLKRERDREEREAQEAERKKLEEKQRRAAREARGEPARNGIHVSNPPASVWTAPKTENSAPAVNGNGTSHSNLLDTFDAESTASSNGILEASTAATSTTEPEPVQRDSGQRSEEEQMAKAIKESEDESGWTTVAQPNKKQQKRPVSGAINGNTAPAVQPAGSGTATRFGALGGDVDDWTA